MLAVKASLNLVSTARTLTNKTLFRSYYKKPFFYEEKYLGKFDYHDQAMYPRRMHPYKEEELLDEVHAMRAKQIDSPSPFHVVRRIHSMGNVPWTQKVTLRRLNLHAQANGDCVVVPNTPQYNSLIAKVKHLLQIKPATFENGQIPTEQDIGALKVCPFTGKVRVDERLRLLSQRMTVDKPLLYQGNLLRYKLKKLYGLQDNHYMK